MRRPIAELLHRARAELACERCQNRGWVMTILGERDECPECHGDKRHPATIELLENLVEHLVDQAPSHIRKVMR